MGMGTYSWITTGTPSSAPALVWGWARTRGSRPALLTLAAPSYGDGHVLHDVGQHVGGGAADHLGLGGGDQPVGQHRGDQLLDVVGDHIVAARHRGRGPGR